MLVKKIGIIAFITGLGVILYRLLKRDNTVLAEVAASTNSDTQVTNVLTTQTKVYNTFTRGTYTNEGTITAGKTFIKITNVGEAEGLLDVGNGYTPLGVGHSWQFSQTANNIIQVSGPISFDATGTQFLVETQQPAN